MVNKSQYRTEIDKLITKYQSEIEIDNPIIPGKDYVFSLPKSKTLQHLEDIGHCWFFTLSDDIIDLEVFTYNNRIGFIISAKDTAPLSMFTSVKVNFYLSNRKVTEYLVPVVNNFSL